MRVIIAGGREITDYESIETAIKSAGFTVTEAVLGGARGADELGKEFCIRNNIPYITFMADWAMWGKRAGTVRNAKMAAYADALIAVPGKGPGTRDMIRKMQEMNKPVFTLWLGI